MPYKNPEARTERCEYYKRWRKAHPEKVHGREEYYKQWRKTNQNKVIKYREANLDKYALAQRRWASAHPEEKRAGSSLYDRQHPESVAARNKRWRIKYPEKDRAHWKAHDTLKDISGCECKKCGAKEHLHRHHPDYSKPCEIVILCRKCHVKEHEEIKHGKLHVAGNGK